MSCVPDLNVEHAQLVLFLFHSLNLMQKKAVLLSVANALIHCAETIGKTMRDSQLLHLSRLLLLLDYLMKHLYDAPPSLLEQVQSRSQSRRSLESFHVVTDLESRFRHKTMTSRHW